MWALLLLVSPALAADPHLRLDSLTGSVQIRSAREIRSVARGAPLPARVPAGSEVVVMSGTAAFSSGHVRVRARAGEAFAFALVLRGGEPQGLALTAKGPRTQLVVEIGDSSVLLYEGAAVSVVEADDGGLEVQSRSGYLTLSEPGLTRILAPGEFAALWPWPASPPLRVTPPGPIVEPGEELRSAPASKRR
ncbi:MAG: hypothetical protein HY553_19440 [Elusimicrobia bacterium]|nr:hypothetical protein [Elusimicrobiota bacterium]